MAAKLGLALTSSVASEKYLLLDYVHIQGFDLIGPASS